MKSKRIIMIVCALALVAALCGVFVGCASNSFEVTAGEELLSNGKMDQATDGKLDSWDTINEAAEEMRPAPDGTPRLIPGAALCLSKYGPPMPGDYVARTFALVEENFHSRPQLHINDWAMCDPDLHSVYANLIRELRQRGCRVDVIGCQMHILWRKQME